jgi:hypothetical protein
VQEKFSTLAEAVAFVESPESAELGEMTVGFRFPKRIRLGKGIWRLTLARERLAQHRRHGLATSINERRASAKASGLLGTRIS